MATTTFGATSDMIKDAAQSIGDAAERAQRKASKGLESAAAGLHAGADTLEDTAKYLRKNRPRDMWANVEEGIKAHPTAVLVGAIAVGFLAGRLLRRS